MADREIKVKLTGDGKQLQSELDKSAEKTEGFGAKIKGLAITAGALAAGAALANFFKQSVEEAEAAEVGMGRLGTAVRNTGGNFDILKPSLEATIAATQRLSTATDDELREALARMITISGDAEGSQKNLALVADLAAFKQISLSDASDIVSRAMTGNVTALNKMGIAGKGATEVLDNARAAFGGFAANEASTFAGTLKVLSNLWGDFQEAVGTAILSSGEMGATAQGLVGGMAELSQWVERNEDKFRLVTNAIGTAVGALFSVGKTIYEILGPSLGFVAKLLGVTLLATLNSASYAVKSLAAAWEYTSGRSLQALGYLVEKGGALLKVFGIDVVSTAGASIREFGATLVASSKQTVTQANAVWAQGMSDLVKGRAKANAALATEEKASGDKAQTETEAQIAKRLAAGEKEAKARLEQDRKVHEGTLKGLADANKQLAELMATRHSDVRAAVDQLSALINGKLGSETAHALGLTSRAMEELLVTLRGRIPSEEWAALNAAVQQHKTSLADLLPPAESLAESAKQAADENKRISDEQGKQEKSIEKNARGTADLARAFVDAASATGLIDDKMSNILQSSITLATNLGKAFGGDPTAIAASVTSLANIIVGIGSSEVERRRQAAATSNTAALDRLTREVGNLNLRESGKTFAGVQSAVDASIQARADARASGKGPGAADEAAKAAFLKSLQSQGIGLEEARSLFKELFGRDLALANAGTFFQDIQAFSQGLQSTEFGQFGKDFEGQLDAATRGFEILGITDADDKLAKFKALAAKFSPALAEALNVNLSTPEGIAQATENLRTLFAKLESGSLSPTEIGVSGNQFLSLISTILPLLGDANGVLASGISAGVGLGNGPVGGIPATGGTVPLLGAPGLPTPILPDAYGTRGVSAAALQVAGGFNTTVTIQVAPREGEDDADFAQRIAAVVDKELVNRVDALKAAAGRLATVSG